MNKESIIEGNIEVLNDVDIFKIKINEDDQGNSKFSVFIYGEENFPFSLLNENLDVIHDEASGSYKYLEFLNAGTYYFVVKGSKKLGQYKFKIVVSELLDDYPNTIRQARYFSDSLVLSGNTSITIEGSSVYKYDTGETYYNDIDIIPFTITDQNPVLLKLTSLGDLDFNFSILDSDGYAVYRSRGSDDYDNFQKNNILIANSLFSGQYYMFVSTIKCSNGYYENDYNKACKDKHKDTDEYKSGAYKFVLQAIANFIDNEDKVVKTLSSSSNSSIAKLVVDEYGDTDTFKVTLLENGFVLIDPRSDDVICYTTDGGNDIRGTSLFTTHYLEKGEYTIDCYAGSYNVSYDIDLKFYKKDPVVNSIEENPSQISLNNALSGMLEYKTDIDFYKFTVSKEANLIVSESVKAFFWNRDGIIEILNEDGSTVNKTETDIESNTPPLFRLSPGDYFVKLYPYYQRASRYDLVFDLDTSFNTVNDDHPNTINSPSDKSINFINIGETVKKTRAFKYESLGDIDIFPISILELGVLEIEQLLGGVNSSSYRGYMELLKENGSPIFQTFPAIGDKNSVLIDPGNYFLKFQNSHYYNLNEICNIAVKFTPDDHQNDINNVSDIELLEHILEIADGNSREIITTNGSIDYVYDEDVYRISIPINGVHEIKVKPTNPLKRLRVTVELYNSNGNLLRIGYSRSNENRSLYSTPIQAGLYLLKIIGYDKLDSFKLESIFSPLTGDTIVDSIDEDGLMPLIDHSVESRFVYQENIFSDDVDIYKIIIPEGGGFLALYSESKVDTEAVIKNSNGNIVLSDSDSGPRKNFTFFEIVEEGEYFLELSSEGYDAGNYMLISEFTSLNDDRPDDYEDIVNEEGVDLN